jgi:hypothetical protein
MGREFLATAQTHYNKSRATLSASDRDMDRLESAMLFRRK